MFSEALVDFLQTPTVIWGYTLEYIIMMESGSLYLKQAAAETSSLTKSFWFGHFLQSVPSAALQACHRRLQSEEDNTSLADGLSDAVSTSLVVCGKTLLQHVEDAVHCLKVCETSLSPNVFELITKSVPADVSTDFNRGDPPDFLCQDCTLNWSTVTDYLGEDIIAERREYSKGARKCGVIAKQVYHGITMVTSGDLKQRMEQYLYWTNSPKTFLDCLDVLRTDPPLALGTHLSVLISSAALERALGDVYLSVSKATQCPSLLRDLLATEELEKTFGSTQMYLLHCLIGPPSGLNLRNVFWHGFPAQSEIPKEYAYLLLVVVSSLGKILSEMGGATPLPIIHRTYVTFPQEMIVAEVFEEIQDCDLPAVEQLIAHSYFVLPTMLPTWKAAIEAYKMKRYHHFLVLLLPALEHGLRRVFACVNGCPERVLTAESTVLYTTFDEILSPVIQSGEPNHLTEEIGVAKLEMLLDLLEHPEGPRLRDRVSHGEVDFHSLSKPIPAHLLCMALLFCVQYSLKEELTSIPPIARCLAVEAGYVSLFHPISLLRRELQQLISHLDEWRHIPRPGCEGEPQLMEETPFSAATRQALGHLVHHHKTAVLAILESIDQLFQDGGTSSSGPLMEVVGYVWGRRLNTLYVPRKDLELTGILRRTVTNASRAVVQLKSTAMLRYQQYEHKQLRSRQRGNYDHLLASLVTYKDAVILLVVLTTVIASRFPLDADSCKRVVKFHKKVLQFSENFYSQTSPTKNRWEEADRLCHSLTTLSTQTPLAAPHVQ